MYGFYNSYSTNNHNNDFFFLIFMGVIFYLLNTYLPKKKEKKGTLDDVIGLESVKEEIEYYMEFIKNKERYDQWNVKLPKGVLLVGPPGVGKTLLVKKMAQSLDIPIISKSGSDFVEMFVGVGAARVRRLFAEARNHEHCIIFIDEIDAVAKKRNYDSNSERDSTLNQLLTEMDGFKEDDNIMIFASTNLVETLDTAILRSGRFDKKIYFDPPNYKEREQMFRLYLKNIKLDRSLSFRSLSDRTAGMTGADIANICNQAKIRSIQHNYEKVYISEEDIQEAIDEVMIGREKRERILTKEEKKRVSYHEAGHAIMGFLLKDASPPIKVSIIPRGSNALGFSQPKPEDRHLYTDNRILSKISVLLGGRCAEMLIYDDLSTGAHDDIEKISSLINNYCGRWGMHNQIGAINISYFQPGNTEYILEESQEIVNQIEVFTFDTLSKYKKYVEKVGKYLYKYETLSYSKLCRLIPKKLENSISEII